MLGITAGWVGSDQKLTTVLFGREMFDNFGWPLDKYDISIPQTILFSIHKILEMGCGTPYWILGVGGEGAFYTM